MSTLTARLGFWRDHRWAQDHVSSYLDRELTPAQAQRMERHLHGCRRCRALLAGLRLIVGWLRELDGRATGEVAPRIAAAVRVRLSGPSG